MKLAEKLTLIWIRLTK